MTLFLILFTITTMLSFRLTRSYQLSLLTLICSYLFIEPFFTLTSNDLALKFAAVLIFCVTLYIPVHKIASNLVARRPKPANNYPLVFVTVFFIAHILATGINYFTPQLDNHSSLIHLTALQWLITIGSMFCAFNVYHGREIRRIIIGGSSLLVSAVLYSLLLGQPFTAGALLGIAGPWSWLILMRATDHKSWVSRLLIAMAIAVSPLIQLASQPTISQLTGLPIIMAGVVCLGDILRCTNTESKLIAAIPTTALIAALSALAVQFSF